MFKERLRGGRLGPLVEATERLGAADPLLMSSAIAYNALFAIVPLAIAAIAAFSLVGASDQALDTLSRILAEFVSTEQVEQLIASIMSANRVLEGSQPVVIIVAMLVALYSGSRAIYTVIKSLRLVQRTEDTRGWIRVRGVGVLFTIGAGLALVVGQVVILVGSALIRFIESWTGADLLEDVTVLAGATTLAAWTWVVIFAIYRWGPPQSAPRPLLSAAFATLLIGLGTLIFGWVIPMISSSTIGVLGAVGVALLWMYYMGLILVSVPEVLTGVVETIRS
jgi:membrane protein